MRHGAEIPSDIALREELVRLALRRLFQEDSTPVNMPAFRMPSESTRGTVNNEHTDLTICRSVLSVGVATPTRNAGHFGF